MKIHSITIPKIQTEGETKTDCETTGNNLKRECTAEPESEPITKQTKTDKPCEGTGFFGKSAFHKLAVGDPRRVGYHHQ